MQQYMPAPSQVIDMDYESGSLPPLFRRFQPTVFQEGDHYCCILGPDRERGIFGCAASLEQSIKDWEMHARERVNRADELDETALFMRDHLSTFSTDVW